MTNFTSNSTHMFKAMIDSKPKKLNDRLLQDYHRKCHMLYAGNITRMPVNRTFINSIVDLHDRLVKEMLDRGMNHNTPLKKI